MMPMRGSRHEGGPDRLTDAGEELQHVAWCAGLPQQVAHHLRDTGVLSAGFTMTVLPVTIAAAVMPVQMASGKFHGLMTTATPRGWCQTSSSSPMKRPSRARLEDADRLAGVVLAEVDRLADVGIGLAPDLA